MYKSWNDRTSGVIFGEFWFSDAVVVPSFHIKRSGKWREVTSENISEVMPWNWLLRQEDSGEGQAGMNVVVAIISNINLQVSNRILLFMDGKFLTKWQVVLRQR